MKFDSYSVFIESADKKSVSRQYSDLQGAVSLSFFQSELLLNCWLESANKSGDIKLIKIVDSCNRLAGFGLVTTRGVKWSGFWPMRRAWLLETGISSLDHIFVEHNGLICSDRNKIPVYDALITHMLRKGSRLDEMRFPGIISAEFDIINRTAEEQDVAVHIYDKKPYFWVKLNSWQASETDYLNSVSRNTSYQIRRATRLFEKMGPIRLYEPSTSTEAIDFFDRLVDLHRKNWMAKSIESKFINPPTLRFHRRLIWDGFEVGAIQLLGVHAGDHEIGYLYNFLGGDTVYCYQSGFKKFEDNRLKPGLVSHAMAIALSKEKGFAFYDFLAGDNQYKRSLSNRSDYMYWIAVQRKNTRQQIEQIARKVKHLLIS